MSDTYQAVYDAVRSRLGGCDIGAAVESAMRNENVGHYFQQACYEMQSAAQEHGRPSAVFKPTLTQDGNPGLLCWEIYQPAWLGVVIRRLWQWLTLTQPGIEKLEIITQHSPHRAGLFLCGWAHFLRQRSEHFLTSSQHFSHFFRHVNGRPQTVQTFVGSSLFFMTHLNGKMMWRDYFKPVAMMRPVTTDRRIL